MSCNEQIGSFQKSMQGRKRMLIVTAQLVSAAGQAQILFSDEAKYWQCKELS